MVSRVPIIFIIYIVLIAYDILDAGVPRIWHALRSATGGPQTVASSSQEADIRDGRKGPLEITGHVDSGCTASDISIRRGKELVSD